MFLGQGAGRNLADECVEMPILRSESSEIFISFSAMSSNTMFLLCSSF